jgi:hypothetical protein
MSFVHWSRWKIRPKPRKESKEVEVDQQFIYFCSFLFIFIFIFVADTFQIQPFHKGLAMQADVVFLFYARCIALILVNSAGCTGTPLR